MSSFRDPALKSRNPYQTGLRESNAPWAVVLAGGDGTRLQRLTLEIAGDARPKQFCKLMGTESLLGQTFRRIAPVFSRDRQFCIVTRAHEAFYRDESAVSNSAVVFEQLCNRGTAVAMGVAAITLLDCEIDPLVAFFPSDHHYSNEGAFVRAVNAAFEYSRQNPREIVLFAAQPDYPETEYGWIEPGAIVSDSLGAQLLRVGRFWEKPSLPKARALLDKHCLWNTFVTIGRATTFLELLGAQTPEVLASIVAASTVKDFDVAYRRLPQVDISREVFSLQPGRLLAYRDTQSGWADLGSPQRVLDTLARNRLEPDWLNHLSLSGKTLDSAIAGRPFGNGGGEHLTFLSAPSGRTISQRTRAR
jgi:mannose-1-phosphate guanylyltransferase